MQLRCPWGGTSKPDCVIDYLCDGFQFSQGGHQIKLDNQQAQALTQRLADIESQARQWIVGQIEEPIWIKHDVGSLEVAVEPESQTRLAFCVQLRNDNTTVAFDLDAAWAVRVYLAEALRQEIDGVYASLE